MNHGNALSSADSHRCELQISRQVRGQVDRRRQTTCSALQLVLLQQQPLLGDPELLLRPFSHALCLGHSPSIQLQLLLQVLEGGTKARGGSLARGRSKEGDAEENCGLTTGEEKRKKKKTDEGEREADSNFDIDKEEGEKEVGETGRAIGKKMWDEMW